VKQVALFCFKLLICGVELERIMGEVGCNLIEREQKEFETVSSHLPVIASCKIK
jgi:hypothetical protein